MSDAKGVLLIYSIHKELNEGFLSCLENTSSCFLVWTSKYVLASTKRMEVQSIFKMECFKLLKCLSIALSLLIVNNTIFQ